MKALLLIIFVSVSSLSFAQGVEEETPTNNNNLPTSDNLVDMQLEVLKPLMQQDESSGVNWDEVDNYLDLVDQMETTEEEKERLRTMYFMQRTDLTQAEKDSIGRILSEAIRNATPE